MASSRAIRAGRAFVELFADDSKLVRGLRGASRRLKRWGSQVRAFGAKLAGFSAAALAPVAIATKIFASFGDQMAKVKAITGASGADFEKLNDKAKELGRTTSFTASQVAGAMVELGRAGFKPAAIDASIPGVLALARATDTELPRAAEIAGNALRGFNLDASETGRIADVLTATANNSSQGLEDIGEALKVVAPIAVEAGESLEDTNAAIGILANNAIKGSLAGNSLARAYKNLSTDKTQKELDAVGVSAVDSEGNLRPLAAIIGDLGDATQNFPSAKKLAIFETLFGRGQAAALKLASSTAEFKDLQAVLKSSSGVAEQTAKTMDDTLGGAFRKLLSAIEGIAIAIGEAVAGSLSNLVERFTAWAGAVTQLIADNKELVAGLIKWTAIAGAAGIAIVGLGLVISSLGTIVGLAGTAFTLLAGAIGFLLTPIGAVVTAVVGLGAVILTQTEAGGAAATWLGGKFEALAEIFGQAWQGIKDAIAAGDLELAFRVVTATLNLLWKKAFAAMKKVWIDFKEISLQIFASTVKGIMEMTGISVKDIIGVWVGLQKGWVETTSFLKDAWSTFIVGFKKTWNSAAGFFKKVWNKIKAAFDKGLDADKLNAEIDRQTARDNARADRDRNEQIAGRDAEKRKRLAEIESGRADAEKALDDFLDDSKRAAEFAKQRKAADDEVKAAEKELADVVAEAARKRKKAEDASDSTDIPEWMNRGDIGVWDQLKKGAEKAGSQLPGATGRDRSGVIATTSALAATRQAFGTRSPEEQQLEQLKRIEKNTKKTEQKLEVPRL